MANMSDAIQFSAESASNETLLFDYKIFVDKTPFFCPPTNYQGCQMVYFQTKTPNFGQFLRDLDWEMLIYFMTVANNYTDI
jgi:hypothetical protein